MQVYHFHNSKVGGVSSVISNLLLHSNNPCIENHIIYTINKETTPVYSITHIKGAVTEKIFYYSSNWNFYYTCKQLAKYLPNASALIVAHDWLELGMVSNLGLQNPVVHIVHGHYDYYYDLAVKHSSIVDAFICVSKKISNNLGAKLTERRSDIFNISFPVASISGTKVINKHLNIIYFVGNLMDNNKQLTTVISIANRLFDRHDDLHFTIAGGGLSSHDFFKLWPPQFKDRVDFKGLKSNEEIIAILPSHDVVLLPSLVEGLPVSLVESMKAGVVPLVTRWEGGIEDLIMEGITGYYFEVGAALDYVERIRSLAADRQLLNRLSDKCREVSNALFDPEVNTEKYEDVFIDVVNRTRTQKESAKIYGSRLDCLFIPNFITTYIRSLRYKKLNVL